MRVVQALHWLRDLLVREGESEQVKRKLTKLFGDPTSGPPLKADLIAGMTALPTWMWVFLKPLVENGAGVGRRRIDDDHDDADHSHHRQGTRDGDDDQRHATVVRSNPKPPSTQKIQTAKRGATRVAKT
jgi:hypothetical protein